MSWVLASDGRLEVAVGTGRGCTMQRSRLKRNNILRTDLLREVCSWYEGLEGRAQPEDLAAFGWKHLMN